MTCAGALIELDASAESVWQVIADLDAYAAWNPWIRRVRGSLRANDALDVELRLPGASSHPRSRTAIVLEMQRHRRLQLLFVSPPRSTAEPSSAQFEEAVYEIEIEPLGPTRVRLVQRLTLAPGLSDWPSDLTELRRMVEAMNEAVRARVMGISADGSPSRQINGTVRVSSHSGLATRCGQRRPGLLRCLADLLRPRPRLAA
jgi:hypothetical protein